MTPEQLTLLCEIRDEVWRSNATLDQMRVETEARLASPPEESRLSEPLVAALRELNESVRGLREAIVGLNDEC